MDEESQVRGCYNITFICTPTNQETVSGVLSLQAQPMLSYPVGGSNQGHGCAPKQVVNWQLRFLAEQEEVR